MNAQKLTPAAWLDEMTVELRLRNVRGTAIGDAVAAVEAHLAESGETPQEAFGDPRAYARSLEFAPEEIVSTSRREWTRLLVPMGAGVLAVSFVEPLVRALHAGTDVSVMWGELLGLIGLVLVVIATLQIIRALLEHRFAGILFFGGAFVILAMLPMLLPQVVFTLPVLAVVAVVVVGLAWSVIGQRLQRGSLDDPLVDPRRPEQRGGAAAVATEWLFVIVALGVGLITWIPLLFA